MRGVCRNGSVFIEMPVKPWGAELMVSGHSLKAHGPVKVCSVLNCVWNKGDI